ncbi:putative bifunctional diguanylate cyclase/phosphodiesterase [Salinarimonas sp. NSM]|uniref:putative bifunctional diguanylate cyclase/phosphodiesterase n=1 Tax=Salinarimonas sp. NSM TaxID=3458003 RepID=UPI004036898F
MRVVRRLRFVLGDRGGPLVGTLILFAGVIATLVAIWGAGSIKRGEIDLGQYMVRHLRYTYAEIVALEGLLATAATTAGDPRAHAMVVNAADRFYVRLDMLDSLSRGPMTDPGSDFAPLARDLMAGLDALVAAGAPMDEARVAATRDLASALVRVTNDYTRGIETGIDEALRRQISETNRAWVGVVGSVLMLLVLSMLSVGLFSRNRSIVSQLRTASGRDSLTGTANRRGFTEWAQRMEAARASPHAVLILDLDRFKAVNDRLGHPAGDAMLEAASSWLRAEFGANGIVARWGGDEFVVAVPLGPGGVADLHARLDARRAHPATVDVGGEVVPIAFSCGIAVWPADAPTIEEAITCADAALYAVKESGRGATMVFAPGLMTKRRRVEALRDGLGRALAERELFLEFQPQVDMLRGTVVAAEALVRWRCGRTGRIVPPGEFIAIAEQSGQIATLDRFVLEEACAAAARWREAGLALRVAVNVSPHSFRSAVLAREVAETLARWGLAPEDLEIEITEGVLLAECDQVGASLAALSAMGVRLALDDFGTGYSNIAYLVRLEPDLLKIDRSFLVEGDPGTRASVLQGVLRLAEALGAETLVEGIETPEQLRFATGAGCSLVQGFHFARPMAAEAIPGFCRDFAQQARAARAGAPAAGTPVALAS